MAKEELIKWLSTEENLDYLNKVQQIKEESEYQKKDFTDRVAKAYTTEEARSILHKHIESLPWKK
ncbi:MAG: hypothetical protein LBE36_02865 [Flavobacteriaceae bacterium]|nr:hypothetical protein [Flavobacteriaceae bacterium]